MIKPFFSHVHICQCGHMNVNNEPIMDRCTTYVASNRDEYLRNPSEVVHDQQKGIYVKQCNAAIDRTHVLPKSLEFTQVYSREIFDAIMKGHELSEFFYETQKNIASLHLALDEVGKKLNIRFRNAGKNRRQ